MSAPPGSVCWPCWGCHPYPASPASHSCLLRPCVHDLDHANPSYIRGISFCQGDVQSEFVQLFFSELVPGNSGSSLVTAVHVPPSSACPDFGQCSSTRLSYSCFLGAQQIPYLTFLPKKRDFTHKHHLKGKTSSFTPFKPKHMRGCDPQKAELPVQSH